jgi:hypothetical protein
LEKPFICTSEVVTTDGGSTRRIIRFDEPIPEKSKARKESSGTSPPKEPVKDIVVEEVEVEEIEASAIEALDEPPSLPPPSSYRPKPHTSNPAHVEQVRELQCAIAAVNRENVALRQYSEWLSRRIQELEQRIVALT